jgi:hypothetical protein
VEGFGLLSLASTPLLSDIGGLQKEISALEELSRQLFMEYVDMLSVKVKNNGREGGGDRLSSEG